MWKAIERRQHQFALGPHNLNKSLDSDSLFFDMLREEINRRNIRFMSLVSR